jgi:hypothetical protein
LRETKPTANNDAQAMMQRVVDQRSARIARKMKRRNKVKVTNRVEKNAPRSLGGRLRDASFERLKSHAKAQRIACLAPLRIAKINCRRQFAHRLFIA